MSWRVAKMCANCPFRPDDAAVMLAPGRLDGIKEAATIGAAFHCHKTVYRDDLSRRPRRDWKECAGALAYRAAAHRADPDAALHAIERLLAEAKPDDR